MNARSLGALMRGAEIWRAQPNVRLIVYAAALVAAFQPLNLLMQIGYGISSLKPLQLWLMEKAWATDDSWRLMRAAWEWVRHAPDGSLYQEIFFERHLKFQYAPTSLLLYSGLEGLGIHAVPVTLNRIGRVLLLASALGMGSIYVGTLVSSLALLALGLWRRGSMSGSAGLAQLLFAALAFTIGAPMAWEPHYEVLAPAFILLFTVLLDSPPGAAKRNWLIALACAFALGANHLPFVAAFAHSPLIPLQSYLLFAGLGIMAMLWRTSRLSAQSRNTR